MPALVSPFVAFALGVFLALRVRGDAERYEDRERRAATEIAALYGAIVFAPVSAYFLVFANDWSFAYLVDTRVIPSALELLLVVGNAALVPLGFVAGHRAARRRAFRELVALASVPSSIAVVFIVAFLRELRVDGTYHQVRARFGTQPVAGGPLGYGILWMDAMLVLGFVLAVRALSHPRAVAVSPIAPAVPSEPPPKVPSEPPAPPRPRLGQRRRDGR